MKIQLLAFTITTILLTACEDSIEKKLTGGWVVDQAYYHDVPAHLNLYSNGFELKPDKTCTFPISNWNDRHTEKESGQWTVIDNNKGLLLNIKSENSLFNRKFKIQNLRKYQDNVSYGYLLKMTLTADSLTLMCTRVL